MSLQCRFYADKRVPVSYNIHEKFDQHLSESSLQIVLVESGCVTLSINQNHCFLQTGALIFCNASTAIEKVYSKNLMAKSITFEPDFVHFECTACREYKGACEVYHHPFYHLFYSGGGSYKGVLPLDPMVWPKVLELFTGAITEMVNQPDNVWCSRARMNLQELFRLAEEEHARFNGVSKPSTPMACRVLEYIHANYEKEITVEMLCGLFHTNHTTLLRDFRKLTNTTIGQYILEYRLQLAKEALLFTALTIDEIAARFGFRQASYLSRVFRARVGLAPSQFRSKKIRLPVPAGADKMLLPKLGCEQSNGVDEE